MLPCLIFEDEHLLVVNKPPGLNTHAPSPYAGEGLYDWLRHREPRWATLAIIHRLDKETSGVIVFSKTPLANRSLTEQFTRRAVHKKYLLLTDHAVPQQMFTVKSALARAGERYVSRPLHPGGETAETSFTVCSPQSTVHSPQSTDYGLRTTDHGLRTTHHAPRQQPVTGGLTLLEAEPLTGRTHQIRVHAADKGFPILGDTLYGGTQAPRVYLHAAEITLKHPASGEELTFRAPADFKADPRLLLRAALIDPQSTNAYRLLHGASDDWPGWYVERLGDFLLSQSEQPLTAAQRDELARLMNHLSARGAYHKTLTRKVCKTGIAEASPQLVLGQTAPERFSVRENGLQFELSFNEGYSVGLFLDQRDNRRRLLSSLEPILVGRAVLSPPQRGEDIAPHPDRPLGQDACPALLNTFAYTCGFSVCAAKAGARTVSLDLSKKYLEWGKRNFALNQLDPAGHDFIYGDVFDWLRRFRKKSRLFDIILLDPPTFSRSKASDVFRAEKDYGKLVAAALPLLKANGVLFASTNAAGWSAEEFLTSIEEPIRAARRKILEKQYQPQPPDFPISRSEPAYLKTLWLRME